MAVGKLGGVVGPAATPGPAGGGEPFGSLLHQVELRGEVGGRRPGVDGPVEARGERRAEGVEAPRACPGEVRAADRVEARAGRPVEAPPVAVTRMVEQVAAAQRRLDHVLRLAQSGRTFTPAELLALQAHVYRASQELDLAGKLVEKATGGVKQVLQTQV